MFISFRETTAVKFVLDDYKPLLLICIPQARRNLTKKPRNRNDHNHDKTFNTFIFIASHLLFVKLILDLFAEAHYNS